MQALPPSDVKDLFARAMIGLDDNNCSPPDNPIGWTAIAGLHRLASREVLDIALACCLDSDPLKRRVGANVLGQLGHSKPGFEPVLVEERFTGLMNLLEAERSGPNDPNVLSDACVALGHLHDARAIPALLALRSHANASVRYGVVMGLIGHEISDALDGLIALSRDPADEVRDWATFGLGQSTADTLAIRAALYARVADSCYGARNEAIEGLSRRGDRTVLPVLIRELRNGASLPLLEAATALAMPELCEALSGAAKAGLIVHASYGPYDLTNAWNEAFRACGCQAG